jgi:hypothetical protein
MCSAHAAEAPSAAASHSTWRAHLKRKTTKEVRGGVDVAAGCSLIS